MKKVMLHHVDAIRIIFLFVLMASCISHAQAQKIYYDQMTRRARNHLCAATITGIPVMGSGLFLALAGFALGNQYNRDAGYNPSEYEQEQKDDATMRNVGIAFFLVGGIVFIAGRSYDNKHKQDYKISLCTPRKNEIGLAYNF